MKIKHVIFDLGGVLIDLDMPHCLESFQRLGIDPGILLQRPSDTSGKAQGDGKATLCDGLVANGDMDLYQTGDISTADFIDSILSHCHNGTTPEQVVSAWNDCLLCIPAYKLEFIQKLRSMGYCTHLLSNTNDIHWQHIRKNDFHDSPHDYFHHLFLSHEMHSAKPNRDIYLSVLNQLQADPSCCLFLDDAQANVDAAASLGIKVFKTPLHYDFREDILSMLHTDNNQ